MVNALKKENIKANYETINITPTMSELLLMYVKLYENMTYQGKKQIEIELDLIGKNYDLIKNK
jgi:hypothetical protein